MSSLANPGRFLRLAGRLLPWIAVLAFGLLAVGLALALVFSPADYQQGDTVRIMYVHVPAAWMGMGGYLFLVAASAVALVWKLPLADLAARASAPVGATFTLICLVSGSLWGKPMWGAWWAWDARLTSMLVLFFLYLGYMALAAAFDDPGRGSRAAAILAIVGGVDLPIIKFSVDWWNTLHQPASLIRANGPTIPPAMLAPLLVMGAAFAGLYLLALLLRVSSEIVAARIRALSMLSARESEPAASLVRGEGVR